MTSPSVTHLPPVEPDDARQPDGAGPDHPMRRVTREVALEGGWSRERAAKVAALFDSLAPEWHTRDNPDRARCVEDALTRGTVDRGLCIELGSGTGFGTSVLAHHFETVIALDLAPEMLRRAPAALAPRVQADAGRLPFANACADAVALVNALLFPDEVARVLAPGGALVWVNTSGDQTPIHLAAEDVMRALPGRWHGIASRIGRGSWCVARRAGLPE